jgi:hypothetical protein
MGGEGGGCGGGGCLNGFLFQLFSFAAFETYIPMSCYRFELVGRLVPHLTSHLIPFKGQSICQGVSFHQFMQKKKEQRKRLRTV